MNALRRETPGDIAEDLTEKAEKTVDRGARKAKAQAREINERVQEGSWADTSLEEAVESSGRAMREMYERGRETVGALGEEAQSHVRRRPFAVIAGAFVAGMLLSRLFRR